MKKDGFTLVELLAVIAILAILVAITMPSIMKEYNKAKANVFVTDAQSFMNAATSKFTSDVLSNAGKTIYYSSKHNSDLNTSKLNIESNKEYFIEMDRHGNIKRFVLYDETYCYDIFTTYGESSIGELEGTNAYNNNGEPISKTVIDSKAVWDSGNDSVDIVVTKNGDKIESYFVKGCEAKSHSYDDDIEADSNVTSLYGVLQKEAEEGTLAKKYTGSHKDSYNRSATHDIYHFHADNDEEATSILNKNNVLFANQCWKIIRTTDTGGVKLLYNGEADDGKCGTSRGKHAGYERTMVETLGNNSYYYGTSYTYDSSRTQYKLSGSINSAVWSSSTASTLIGKYTCISENPDGGCRNLKYIYDYIDERSARVIDMNFLSHYSSFGSIYYNIGVNISSIAYMYGYQYESDPTVSFDYDAGVYFGKSVTYENGKYKLNNTIVKSSFLTLDESNIYHFYCPDGKLECSKVVYQYYRNSYTGGTILLDDGVTNPIDALNNMLRNNTTNSMIKTGVDKWYEAHLSSYTNYLEETIYCNDRSYLNLNESGWNPNGGNIQTELYFKNYNINSSLECSLDTDKFSTSNNLAKLNYSIGLATSSEMNLLNNDKARAGGATFWTGSPSYVAKASGVAGSYTQPVMNTINYSGSFLTHKTNYYIPVRVTYSVSGPSVVNPDGSVTSSVSTKTYESWQSLNLRPMISLKTGTKFVSGDGSTDSPYVVE